MDTPIAIVSTAPGRATLRVAGNHLADIVRVRVGPALWQIEPIEECLLALPDTVPALPDLRRMVRDSLETHDGPVRVSRDMSPCVPLNSEMFWG